MTTTSFTSARDAFEWLRGRIAAVKEGDPLAPATVLVANHYVGLVLRRRLAEAGYVNVRFSVLGQVAEPLAAPRLAQRGYSPLSTPVQEAAIRAAIADAGAELGAAAEHPSVATMLRRLFETLRARDYDDYALRNLAARGRVAEQALAVYARYLEIIRSRRLYDARRLLDEAVAELTDNGPAAVAGMGAVFAHLLPPLREPERGLIQALERVAHLESSSLEPVSVPAPRVLRAPDAVEEVRWAVRDILRRAEAGTRLDRMAIAYAANDPYAGLVRETLGAAAIPWAGLDGRPLSETRPGRVLLGALRLRENDFARVNVLALLGALPHRAVGFVPVGQWDRLSRKADIVKGASEWRARLDLYATQLEIDARGYHEDDLEDRAVAIERQAAAARRMSARITELERQVRPPEERTWPALGKWAAAVLKNVSAAGDDWPDADREGLALVQEVIEGLAAAGRVEPEVTVATFVGALEAALTARRQAEGRAGVGLLVGPLRAIAGIPLDHVAILGMGERALPTLAPPDAVFPTAGEEDVLGLRAERLERERWDFAAGLGAAPQPLLGFAAWDADLRPSYPSRWVVDLASQLDGVPVAGGWLREPEDRPWLDSVHSPDAGLRTASVFLNPAEWIAAEARKAGPNLTSSPVGRRPGPMQRNLQVREARFSNRFTEFDGNVGAIAEASERLRDGIARGPLSPSRIEAWATCPFQHFLRSVVHVEPTERPEQDVVWGIDSLTRGTLVHQILQRFFEEQAARGRPAPGEAWNQSDHARIDAITDEEVAKLEARGAVSTTLAWDTERAAMLADLHTALEKDVELRGSLVPSQFEQEFGMDGGWPAPEIDLGDGRTVQLRGRIDRVDRSGLTASVIDYKSGKFKEQNAFDADPVDAGQGVQLASYIAAVRAADPTITSATATYWFLSAKGQFRRVTVDDSSRPRLESVLRVVDRGIRAGAFPQVPGLEGDRPGRPMGWDNCHYCDFNRICPTGRDQVWERKHDEPGASVHGELARD